MRRSSSRKHGCFSRLLKGFFLCFCLLLVIGFFSGNKKEPSTTVPPATATPAPTITQTIAPTEVLPDPTATITPQPATPTPTLPPIASFFEIHFLDVGQGDSALVMCDGSTMLIDGGDSSASSLIYSYLKQHNIQHLDYIIASHPHDDHIGGLSGALNYATVGQVLCPVSDYDSKPFASFIKYLGKQGKSISVPAPGDTFALGSASVEVLAPLQVRDSINSNSLVLRIVYGNTSFLFTGDAEKDEESDLTKAKASIKSTVLKVGHHGSSTSSTKKFISKVKPKYAVISVGKDNDYGHPDKQTLDALKKAKVKVFRTDLQGHIICKSNGESVEFTVEKNKDINTLVNPTPKPTATPTPTKAVPIADDKEEYVLNKGTKKFHYEWCSSVDDMKEKNKAYFTGTRDEVIKKGYKPCKRCDP